MTREVVVRGPWLDLDADYATLRSKAFVVRTTADPAGWRKEVRARCRADGVKVRTGRTDRSDGSVGVWAYLPEMMEEQGNLIDAWHEAEAANDADRLSEIAAQMRTLGMDKTPREVMERVDALIFSARRELE